MEQNGNNKKYMFCVALLLFSVLALCVFWLSELILSSASGNGGTAADPDPSEVSQTQPEPVNDVFVSHSSGFYRTGILLEMYPREGYDIYYTVTMASSRSQSDGRVSETGEGYFFIGGKNPDPANVDETEYDSFDNALFNSKDGRLKTYKYTKPLDLVNPGNFSALVISVKAAVYRDDVMVSPVRSFTYILGSAGGDKTFSDIFGSMLIHITVDDELLYDYEKGIFVNGKKYDEAIAQGVAIDPWTPRNSNMRGSDWERLAHVDFFEADGTLVLSQVCGIRIAGGTSRNALYKSLKLVAGSGYDGNERFNYNFFENAKDSDGKEITSFRKLVLRNPRNDIGGTMIRDQLLHKIGGDVGVDYQEGRNAVVFLNGKYYSIMCLHESLDAEYMEDHYFVNKSNVASFLIRSDQYQFRYKQENGTEDNFESFIADMNYLIFNDFSGKSGFEKISQVIDVDNFCRYMAYQLFIVNLDWPHNNVLVWRYYGPSNSSVKAMDGRWRFVLKDLDFGLVDAGTDTFASCLNDGLYGGEPCIGTVLRSCLKNAEFKRVFRENCQYVASMLSKEYLDAKIDEAVNDIAQDMQLYSLYNGVGLDGWRSYFDIWHQFASERQAFYLKLLDKYAPER